MLFISDTDRYCGVTITYKYFSKAHSISRTKRKTDPETCIQEFKIYTTQNYIYIDFFLETHGGISSSDIMYPYFIDWVDLWHGFLVYLYTLSFSIQFRYKLVKYLNNVWRTL